jgi:Tfp pilus assembly protein FimT
VSSDARPVGRGQAGFTVLEMMMAVATTFFMLSFTFGAYRQFNEAIVVKKSAGLVGGDLVLARSYAIQRRANVSLVARETERAYVIRDTTGEVLARRSYGVDSGLGLDVLDVQATGDSVTFNSRGLLTNGTGVDVVLSRGERSHTVYLNALGRYQVVQP